MKTIGLIGGTSWVSTQEYYKIINQHVNQKQDAEGIILACTEIPRLISSNHFDLPIFSTLEIHAYAIADFALKV